MKILVTGTAGFIGSHLAERLLADGHEVVGIDNFHPYYSPRLKRKNISMIKSEKFQFMELDLVDVDAVKQLPKDVEAIFHLAAQPGISDKVPFSEYVKNNIMATYNLLEYARSLADFYLFINVATSSVYGAYAVGDESSVPRPTSYYGVTKLAAEQLALSYFRDKGLPVCSARPFSVYGERERPEKMYAKLIKSILEGTEFPLFEGSMEHKRSFTYVGDVVDGLVRMSHNRDAVIGQEFNLGTRDVQTTGRGIEIIESIMGKKARFKTLPRRAGDQQETRAVIDKAEQILGYAPQTTLEQGLAKQVEWYVRHIYGKIEL